MYKLTASLLLSLFIVTILPAQKKSLPGKDVISNALKEIKDFQAKETKHDSITGHPLGSNKEEDFLRHYNFYIAINKKLNSIVKEKLFFDDQINLELLQYSIEDEISSYKFKSYLNPILSDEGFHTGLAAMGSEVLTSKKEFEDSINRLNDIPRYVDENLNLMRRGLELSICQPRSILNAYEITYDQLT